MILYYSGAESNLKAQILPENSLGGFISSSVIPNGKIDSIFSPITRQDILEGRIETRMLVLTNTTGADLTGVKIWWNTTANSLSKLTLAAVAPALDPATSIQYFERIADSGSIPYQATLAEHASEGDAINVGTMAANATIGIWISRQLDPTKFPLLGTVTDYSDAYIQMLQDQQDGNGILRDDCELVVKWD